jgi:hypothetical protein
VSRQIGEFFGRRAIGIAARAQVVHQIEGADKTPCRVDP